MMSLNRDRYLVIPIIMTLISVFGMTGWLAVMYFNRLKPDIEVVKIENCNARNRSFQIQLNDNLPAKGDARSLSLRQRLTDFKDKFKSFLKSLVHGNQFKIVFAFFLCWFFAILDPVAKLVLWNITEINDGDGQVVAINLRRMNQAVIVIGDVGDQAMTILLCYLILQRFAIFYKLSLSSIIKLSPIKLKLVFLLNLIFVCLYFSSTYFRVTFLGDISSQEQIQSTSDQYDGYAQLMGGISFGGEGFLSFIFTILFNINVLRIQEEFKRTRNPSNPMLSRHGSMSVNHQLSVTKIEQPKDVIVLDHRRSSAASNVSALVAGSRRISNLPIQESCPQIQATLPKLPIQPSSTDVMKAKLDGTHNIKKPSQTAASKLTLKSLFLNLWTKNAVAIAPALRIKIIQIAITSVFLSFVIGLLLLVVTPYWANVVLRVGVFGIQIYLYHLIKLTLVTIK